MTSLINFLKVNLTKMHRYPGYRYLSFILGLPVNLIAYFIYRKDKVENSYTKAKEKKKKELLSGSAAEDLKKEVEAQLRKKIEFLNKKQDDTSFKKDLERIYNERFNELLEAEFKKDTSNNSLKEITFMGTYGRLMDHTGFFLLSVLLAWPMYILALIYSNAYIKYIAERIFMMIFVIFGVTFLVFTILYLSPLDAALNILGPMATPEQVNSFNATYGLDKPYFFQLLDTFKGLMTLNLGKSYVGNEDVLFAIMRKFPITLKLTFASLLLAVTIAVPAGIVSAVKPYSAYDYIFMLLALIGLSIPTFWMGLILILNFSIKGNMLPATFDVNNWKSMIMPSIVLGTSLAATVARMTRSSMLEVIKQDYIVTAKAKGLSKSKVIIRHALANAMIPIVTVIGLQFGGMLGGSAVTEKVFNVNGIGSYIVDKQFVPDVPVVLAGVVYVAIIISFINLIVDVLYAFLDPRIKSKLKSY